MEDTSVVIVIPIYKNILSQTEKVSLQQLNNVLGRYTRVFVVPESLGFDFGDLGGGIRIERFGDRWFQSVTSYSCLLLQKEFYERFSDYEYMLVYQLDAFVFSDRLKEFCNKGYDYIGAPVGKLAPFWHAIGAAVGNGGFSLRRIPSVIRVLDDFDDITKDTPFFPFFTLEEDLFFAYCGRRDDVDFTVADFDAAIEFSVQENVRHVYDRVKKGWRPFGCHGWNKIDYPFWNSIIEAYGYDLPEIKTEYVVYIYGVVKEYILHRSTFNLQPAWGWVKRGESSRLELFFEGLLEKYPEGSTAWEGRLAEITLFWCAVTEAVQTGRLPMDMDREAVLTSVFRAMKSGNAVQYLWEMWDMMLPVLGKETYPVREKIIRLVLEKKLEKYVILEKEKIDSLLKKRAQITSKQFSLERQIRLQTGQKLFEKALEWNVVADTDLWKQYTEQLMNL